MASYSKHYYLAKLKKWEWDSTTNSLTEGYVEVEKEFTAKELETKIREFKHMAILQTLILILVGSLGFLMSWLIGLVLTASFGIISIIYSSVYFHINHCIEDYIIDLGWQDDLTNKNINALNQVFQEELLKIEKENNRSCALALKWRKKHPLEEKVRLALMGNPNAIAELLRYCSKAT